MMDTNAVILNPVIVLGERKEGIVTIQVSVSADRVAICPELLLNVPRGQDKSRDLYRYTEQKHAPPARGSP